jgi:HSP20 family protein
MAEVDVKKQSLEQQRNPSGQPLEHGHSRLQHQRAFPSLFSLGPSELFHASPFSLMRRFTNEMDRIFESAGGWRASETAQWAPAIEVSERDGKLEVVADLPGIKESDVKVEVTDEGLVIQGERKQGHEEKREGFYRSERSYGQFYRLIPLPEDAHVDQARAEFHNGELRVTVPIPEQQQQRKTRQIPITTTGGDRKEPQSQAAAGQQGRRAAG